MSLIKVLLALILCGIVITYGNNFEIFMSVILTIIVVLCITSLEFGGRENDNKS